MQNVPTPAKLVEQEMERNGVSRESAIQMILLGTEANLRADGPDERSAGIKVGELLIKVSKERPAWLSEYMAAGMRKDIPGWIKINDEALERGQDPVTVLSIKESISMSRAEERIKTALASKEGKSMDQLVELSYDMGDAKSPEARQADMLEMFS